MDSQAEDASTSPRDRRLPPSRYWLEQELRDIQPTVVVVQGSTALEALLKRKPRGLAQFMGRPLRLDERWIIATYHPPYIRAPRMPSSRTSAPGSGRRPARGQGPGGRQHQPKATEALGGSSPMSTERLRVI